MSYFKSEISLVSFSLTATYMYFHFRHPVSKCCEFLKVFKMCPVIFIRKFIHFPMWI